MKNNIKPTLAYSQAEHPIPRMGWVDIVVFVAAYIPLLLFFFMLITSGYEIRWNRFPMLWLTIVATLAAFASMCVGIFRCVYWGKVKESKSFHFNLMYAFMGTIGLILCFIMLLSTAV